MGDATEDKTESKTQKKNRKKREKEEARKAATADEQKSGGGVEDADAPIGAIPANCFSLADAYDEMLRLAVTVMDRATLQVRGEGPVQRNELKVLRGFMPSVVGNLEQALMLIRNGEKDINKFRMRWTIQHNTDLEECEHQTNRCAAAQGSDTEPDVETAAMALQQCADEGVGAGFDSMDPHQDTQRGGHKGSPSNAATADDNNAQLWKEAQAHARGELDSQTISADAYQAELYNHTVFIFRMLKKRNKAKFNARHKKGQRQAHASMRRK